jgi:hypothetical protein
VVELLDAETCCSGFEQILSLSGGIFGVRCTFLVGSAWTCLDDSFEIKNFL